MVRRSTLGFAFTATIILVMAARGQTIWYVDDGGFDATEATFEESARLAFAGPVFTQDDKGIAGPRIPPSHTSHPDERSYKDCKIVFTSRPRGEMTTDIYSMNADGTGLTHLTKEMFVYGLSWSPNGENISFTGLRGEEGMKELGEYGVMFAHWQIFAMNADGEDIEKITTIPISQNHWSPNGKSILFTSGYEDKENHHGEIGSVSFAIYRMDSNGENQKRLTDISGYDVDPLWSADGEHIIYGSTKAVAFAVAFDKRNWEIMIMKADGSEKKNLTNNRANDQSAIFSADGEQIVFVSQRDGPKSMYIMDRDGGNVKRLTDKSPNCLPLYCTKDERIIYSVWSGTHIMDFDGGKQRMLTKFASAERHDLSLSPDERMLIYIAVDGERNRDIYSVDINGGDPVNLTNSPRQERMVSWSPFLKKSGKTQTESK